MLKLSFIINGLANLTAAEREQLTMHLADIVAIWMRSNKTEVDDTIALAFGIPFGQTFLSRLQERLEAPKPETQDDETERGGRP